MGRGPSDELEVEVVYCTPSHQWLTRVVLPAGARVREALVAANVYRTHGWSCDAPLALGIYGTPVDGATPLRAGDRVEIYHPLPVDPKERRRRRAQGRRQKPL